MPVDGACSYPGPQRAFAVRLEAGSEIRGGRVDHRDGTAVSQETQISERAITVSGLVISILGAFVVPSLVVDADPATDIIIGLVSFGVGYLMTMDLAFRARARETEGQLLRRIDEVDQRRYGALPMQRLLSVPEIEDAVRDMVEAAANARSKRMPFLANRTIERIQRDRNETLRIASGIFRCATRREELRLLRYALDDSVESMDAVAGLGLDHWSTPEFREYFDIYLEHAPRIRQTRIFLVTRAEMRSPEMLEILENHASQGVTLYALDREQVPEPLRRPLVLFDSELLLSHTRRDPSLLGAEVQFTDDPSRVLEAREDMASLLRIARRPGSPAVLYTAEPGLTRVAVAEAPLPDDQEAILSRASETQVAVPAPSVHPDPP